MVNRAPPECYSHIRNVRMSCLASCNLDLCPLNTSYWDYLPSLAANGLFTALFSISLLAFSVQAVIYRKYLGFSIAMISGSILEILGYAGRVWAHEDPFSEVCTINHSRQHLMLTSLEPISHPNRLSHHRPSILRRRHLLLSLPHSDHFRRIKLAHRPKDLSPSLHRMRHRQSSSAGHRRRHGVGRFA